MVSERSEKRGPSAIVMILWAVLGLALAIQVIRMRVAEGAVRSRNGSAASEVRPQNGWARTLLAERFYEQGRLDQAMRESLAALRATPLAAGALRTMALVREKQSGPGSGESAWQAAATMGWRDKETQLWGVLRALANGEAAILAMRADALLRTGDDGGKLSVMIRSFMREPEVRAAFVERLALNPPWRRHFLTTALGARGEDLDGLVATLHDLARTSSPPTRNETRMAIEGLIARRRYEDAARLHALVANRDPRLPMDDESFGRSDRSYRVDSTPFDWMIRPVSHSSATLDESGRRSISISTRGGARQAALRRYVLVDPGRYRLAFAMRGEPDSPQFVGVSLACPPETKPFAQSDRAPLPDREWHRRQMVFEVPAGCPVISIGVGGFGSEASDAQFDDFRLERADSAASPSR